MDDKPAAVRALAAAATALVLGTVGIVAALTWLATFGMVPPGIPESTAVYAFVLWQLVIGGFLLYVTQRRHLEAAHRPAHLRRARHGRGIVPQR